MHPFAPFGCAACARSSSAAIRLLMAENELLGALGWVAAPSQHDMTHRTASSLGIKITHVRTALRSVRPRGTPISTGCWPAGYHNDESMSTTHMQEVMLRRSSCASRTWKPLCLQQQTVGLSRRGSSSVILVPQGSVRAEPKSRMRATSASVERRPSCDGL